MRYDFVEDIDALLYYCNDYSWIIISSDKLIEEYPTYRGIVDYYSNYFIGSFYMRFDFYYRITIKKNFRNNIAKKIIRYLLNPDFGFSSEIIGISRLEMNDIKKRNKLEN